jgi:DNA (cytosine-5)-methyltransferase 1
MTQNETLTFGSLFAGIGGFDLGLERSGMRCRWQVEIDPFAQSVIAKHWPDVGQWDDVRTFPPHPASDWAVDVICGGFPCTDISQAGGKSGIDGEMSGLWAEYRRIILEIRPRVAIVENVSAITSRGLDRVLGDLAEIGFDAVWHCIPATAVGAPIGGWGRDRIWIVAVPNSGGCKRQGLSRGFEWKVLRSFAGSGGGVARLPDSASDHWENEPDVGRVAVGVPDRMDRIRCLGNSVVPQVAEWIGRRILQHK